VDIARTLGLSEAASAYAAPASSSSQLFSQPSKIENTAVLWQFTDRGDNDWPQ
jgi:hypothetical protein